MRNHDSHGVINIPAGLYDLIVQRWRSPVYVG
jgi:hypothetical protein